MLFQKPNHLMIKIILFYLIMAANRTLQDDHDDLIQTVSNFFDRRHVQTITVATCWPSEVNEQLLKKLSAMDKSLSFSLTKWQTHNTWYRQGFMVDLSCDKSVNFMHKVSAERIFTLQNDWVLLNGGKSNVTDPLTVAWEVFQTFFSKSYVLPDSGVFLYQKTENRAWEIWSGFRASKSDTLRVFRVGTASKDRMEFDGDSESRKNFQGVRLKATAVVLEPNNFHGFNRKTTSGLDVFGHMHYNMIEVLAYQLNFTFNTTFTNDPGRPYGNGSFSGLVDILQKEESDFGTAGSIMRPDRMAGMDYTVGTVFIKNMILFKQPKLSIVTNIHIQPFKLNVWLTTLVLLVGFVFVMLLMNKFKANHRQSLTTLDIIELVHGATCQQGSPYTLNLVSTKVVVIVLFLTTLFLFNAYSAMIVSLFQSTATTIKTVEDITQEKSMTINVQISPYAKSFFNETKVPAVRKLYDIKIKPSGQEAFVNMLKGMEMIRTQFHGFMVEMTSAYRAINGKWQEDEKCGLFEIHQQNLPILSIPIPKKSGHKDVFKQMLIQQQEVGIRRRVIDQWTPSKPTCDLKKINGQYVSVSIKEILSTLKLFGYGVLTSLVTLIFELAYHASMKLYTNKFWGKN